MNVTVCELPNEPALLEDAWAGLCAHARQMHSDLVVLPEMPFFPWLAHSREVVQAQWRAAVAAHDAWMERFEALAPAVVTGSRPVVRDGLRLNAAYVVEPGGGARLVHAKRYLPDEPGFWEASWYQRGDDGFHVLDTACGRIGFLICTELWFSRHARDYAAQGVQILACPRATPASSADKWVAGGRAAAVVSGAFCVSSNFAGTTAQGGSYAGRGWVVEPEEGGVLALTSAQAPFATVEIDPAAADRAKRTYPRYVEG